MSDLIASQAAHLTLRVHGLDNVRVALTDLPAGTVIEDHGSRRLYLSPQCGWRYGTQPRVPESADDHATRGDYRM